MSMGLFTDFTDWLMLGLVALGLYQYWGARVTKRALSAVDLGLQDARIENLRDWRPELRGRLGPRTVRLRRSLRGGAELRVRMRPGVLPEGLRLEPEGEPPAATSQRDLRVDDPVLDRMLRIDATRAAPAVHLFKDAAVRQSLSSLINAHRSVRLVGDEIIVRHLPLHPSSLRACLQQAVAAAEALESASAALPPQLASARSSWARDVRKAYSRNVRKAVLFGIVPMFAGPFLPLTLWRYGLLAISPGSTLYLAALPLGPLLGLALFVRFYRCPTCRQYLVRHWRNLFPDDCPQCGVRLR